MSLVSVILPAHDVAAYAGAAVRAVGAQDWPDFELIAVDDGSRDATAAAIETAMAPIRAAGHRAVLLRQDNGGLGAARNAALAAARGDLLLFADADDLLDPDAMRHLAQALKAHPAARMTFPRCRHVGPGGAELGVLSPRPEGPVGAGALLADNPIHTDTGVMLRRAALPDPPRFDTGLPSAIGLDFWLRASAGGGACILPLSRVLVSYRRRPGQITSDWRRQKAGWERVAGRAALPARELRAARARAGVVWATSAYQAGDHGAARRLMAGALRADPAAALGNGAGRIRLAAVIASLLPGPLHGALARLANRTGS
ncbi:glycosyltransferase family 2 protein [Profundibacterium mesophilum]|uniref:Glycoprotein 3-alpha-L-fucosyltransferase n=1 Tax=Profundibacterium mesophilum KAUST100406-0324 TaxID=1037889 RepID=A0A921TEX4_9RHOB|nr:glycosyltransferase family 2 protein [Profundibacterium mesophilum]KAF0675884.1 glycoprotein 3-alpha-L-fucosyltransferase [Profundibacterium mesophilum KAUST100406-0324]